ncbi:GntP, partial [Pasteurella multocida subsp. multocida str. Anand1_buffalo]
MPLSWLPVLVGCLAVYYARAALVTNYPQCCLIRVYLLLLLHFIIALALRVAQGSATVALTTASALIAPTVAATTGLSQLDLCFIVIAIASGATALSHVNDSGFWLVSRFLEMDRKN